LLPEKSHTHLQCTPSDRRPRRPKERYLCDKTRFAVVDLHSALKFSYAPQSLPADRTRTTTRLAVEATPETGAQEFAARLRHGLFAAARVIRRKPCCFPLCSSRRETRRRSCAVPERSSRSRGPTRLTVEAQLWRPALWPGRRAQQGTRRFRRWICSRGRRTPLLVHSR
jgi:hypothetical protein